MSPPIIATTAQAALFSIVSSILAQAITAFQSNSPLSLDWSPIFQLFVFSVVSTPPNILWQVFLEDSFPGSSQDEKHKQKMDSKAPPSPPPPARLNWRNTLTKTLLDQSVGASVNVLLLCTFVGAWEQGMQPLGASAAATITTTVAGRIRADFLPLLFAGWRFWPWVSLGSFALVPDLSTRNLVGGLAGLAWGVYLSLATATVKVATD